MPLRPHQDQVGHTAHHLTDEALFRHDAQLVHRGEADVQQPLVLRLGDGQDPPAGHLLAQQHTQHGGRFRVVEFLPGEMDPGPRPGAQQQAYIALVPAPEMQDDPVPAGHGDLVHPGVFQPRVQFLRQPADHKTVKRHDRTPPICAGPRPHGTCPARPGPCPPGPFGIFPAAAPQRTGTADPPSAFG